MLKNHIVTKLCNFINVGALKWDRQCTIFRRAHLLELCCNVIALSSAFACCMHNIEFVR